MLEHLTIQTFVEGQWHDALELTVDNPAKVRNGSCSTAYAQVNRPGGLN